MVFGRPIGPKFRGSYWLWAAGICWLAGGALRYRGGFVMGTALIVVGLLLAVVDIFVGILRS